MKNGYMPRIAAERMWKKHYWGTSMPYRIPVAGSRECIAEDAGSNQTF